MSCTDQNDTGRRNFRVFIGGLPPSITTDDVLNRFKSFGQVSDIALAKHQFEDKDKCRGFGFFNMETSDLQWKRCLNIYNNSSWQGLKVRLEQARPKVSTIEMDSHPVAVKANASRTDRKLVRHAKDMNLVTDKNVEQRKGWKKGRYGRAMAIVKLSRPDGKQIIVDPSHYKNNLEKLFGTECPLPLHKLTWSLDNSHVGSWSPPKKERPDKRTKRDKSDKHAKPLSLADPSPSVEAAKVKDNDESATNAEAKASVWLNVIKSEAQPFSLAAKFGLLPEEVTRKPEPLEESTAPDSTMAYEEVIEPLMPADFLLSYRDLLNAGSYCKFALGYSYQDYLDVWKQRKAELKYDCKLQIKQAKKLVHRKQKSFRASVE